MNACWYYTSTLLPRIIFFFALINNPDERCYETHGSDRPTPLPRHSRSRREGSRGDPPFSGVSHYQVFRIVSHPATAARYSHAIRDRHSVCSPIEAMAGMVGSEIRSADFSGYQKSESGHTRQAFHETPFALIPRPWSLCRHASPAIPEMVLIIDTSSCDVDSRSVDSRAQVLEEY